MRDDVKPINAKVGNETAPLSSLAKPITSLGLTWRWRRSVYHLGVDWFDVIAHAQRSVVDSYGAFSQAHWLQHPEAAEMTSKFTIFFLRNYECDNYFIIIYG